MNLFKQLWNKIFFRDKIYQEDTGQPCSRDSEYPISREEPELGTSLFTSVDEALGSFQAETVQGSLLIEPEENEIKQPPKTDMEIIAEPEDTVSPENPEESDLLENIPFVKLMEQCSELVEEFDLYSERVSGEESKMIIDLITQRLREAMYLSGASPIEGENRFNLLRHTPVPLSLAKEQTPIEKTLEPGVVIGNRVFVKAKVQFK